MPKAPEGHSILSASSANRWFNCPGSVEAVKNYPNEESVYAAEGTVAHGIIADCLLNKNPVTLEDLEKKIGDTVMQGEFEIEITEEMIEAVWEFIELVSTELDHDVTMLVEQKVNLDQYNVHLWGTADVVLIKPFHWIKVIDFKYGAGIKVSAYQNKQLMYYLSCIWEQEDVESGEIIICQPRLSDSYDSVSRYEVSHEEYVDFKKELLEKAQTALKKDAPRQAGDWCKSSFCPAFADCPAAHNLAYDIVSKDFADPLAPENLPIEKIKLVLDKAEFIRSWVSAVSDHAKQLMLNGEPIPGYKLVQGYGHRKWQSEAAVEEDFADLGAKLYEKPKIKSPAKLEKIVGKDRVADYAYKPETAVKLVPDSAKGEPIHINHKEDYDD